LEHHAAVEPRQLDGTRDDGGEHRLEIERRADCLADLAERDELPNRARQLLRPRLHFLEQPDVLDRDHRLAGEGLEDVDLVFGNWYRLCAADPDMPDRRFVEDHRYL